MFLKSLEEKFIEVFNIKDSTVSIFLPQIANCFTSEVILALEEIILDWNYDCEIIITKIDGKYYYEEIDRDDNHRVSKKKYKTRKDALLGFLIQYSDIEDIYDKVREVFGICRESKN